MARELMKPGLAIEKLAYITKLPLEELKKDLDIKIDLNLIAREKIKKEPDLNSNEPDISTNTLLIRLCRTLKC